VCRERERVCERECESVCVERGSVCERECVRVRV